MLNTITQKLSIYSRQTIGFAFFLAWCYCSFFSCGLVSHLFITQGVERVWGITGTTQALGGLIVMIISSKLFFAKNNYIGSAAAVGATCGTVLIWTSFAIPSLHLPLSIAGGLIAGASMALLAVVWGGKLSECDEGRIEFAVPLSFAIAFGIYFLLLVVKGFIFVVVDAFLPLASIWFAFYAKGAKGTTESATKDTRQQGDYESPFKSFKSLVPLFLIVMLLWMQFAYFRVLSTPDVMGDRFLHYLIPFSCSFILAIIAFLVCMRKTRYMNFTFMYRWALPLMMISYGLLFLNQGYFDNKMVAYTVNFIAMFGMQLSSWVAAAKYAQRMEVSSNLLFGGISAAEGMGVACGTALSFLLQSEADIALNMEVSLLLMGFTILIVMIIGFNPNWFFFHATGRSFRTLAIEEPPSGMDKQVPSGSEKELNNIFETRALELQRIYGFTSRETDVAALLLAGYARSYIRDELVVSLNTVHAHVRSIYAKCDIHSRREFMDLMETRESEEMP